MKKKYQLYEDDDHSIVYLDSYSWGMYECVKTHNFDKSLHAAHFIGKSQDTYHSPAIWVCDRNHAISFSGETEISGDLYLPKNGLSYINLNFDSFRGGIVPSTSLYTSNKDFPLVDSTYLQIMRALIDPPAHMLNEIPFHYHSFLNDPLYASVMDVEEDFYAKGRVIFYGDKVRIHSSSKISDIILIARCVTIESGFSGSLQIMASDTVEINEGVSLHHPSGVYIYGDRDKAYLHISSGSHLKGYAIVEGNAEGGNGFVVDIHYRQDKGSQLTGLLFVDGIAHLEGTVLGAAYVKECFYLSGENMYSGLIYNGIIRRSNNLAFPFLFKDSEFNRKIVKKLE